MLVAITDIYYSMFILLAFLMIRNSLFVVHLFELGKYRYRYRYRKKMANIEEISYRIKKLLYPIPILKSKVNRHMSITY